MSQPQSERQPYRFHVTLLGLAVLAAAIAVAVVGWALDVSAVRSVIPGAVGMKFQTALGLGTGAAAVLLLDTHAQGHRRTLGLLLATVPGLLAIAALFEYVFRVKLGIDEFPFIDHDGRAAGIAYPGRLAPTNGVCFLLLTAALLTLDRGARWRWRPSELLAVPVGIGAFTSLIAYAYSIPAFYGPGAATKMGVNTALCFLALAVALLVARPRGRVLELATTTTPAGVVVRRMVPICVVVPLILGWLHLRFVSWGVFNVQVGAWWIAATTTAGLVGLIWWCAGTLSRTDGKRRVLEAHLYELANRDSLTGLFSRHRFEDELDQLLARARRYGDSASLLLLDLDRMKPVNDTLGHATGDELLRNVADVVRGRLREADVVGRLGGDEFAALLLEATPSAAMQIANDLCAAIVEIKIETPDGTCWTSASIGVAPVDASPGLSASELLARADVAMYRAKRAGGNRAALTEHVSTASSHA